jgi:hypothetical protein
LFFPLPFLSRLPPFSAVETGNHGFFTTDHATQESNSTDEQAASRGLTKTEAFIASVKLG